MTDVSQSTIERARRAASQAPGSLPTTQTEDRLIAADAAMRSLLTEMRDWSQERRRDFAGGMIPFDNVYGDAWRAQQYDEMIEAALQELGDE